MYHLKPGCSVAVDSAQPTLVPSSNVTRVILENDVRDLEKLQWQGHALVAG
jgi:hypothetical protein